MKEIICKGKVVFYKKDDIWQLEDGNDILTANILTRIDEILDNNNMEILEDGEEIEIIVKLKNRN